MKSVLRKQLKQKRVEVPDKEDKSAEICKCFLNTDTYKNSELILCYSAIQDEVATDLIINTALNDGKKLALPRCIDKDGTMKYYVVTSLDDLQAGSFGIMEPKPHCEEITYFSNAVCIVPALSFDMTGYRLGYGKGYYDRFLEKFGGVSVGLCYDDLICTSLPVNQFDKRVNMIITENSIISVKEC